jgi:hypothetical protein
MLPTATKYGEFHEMPGTRRGREPVGRTPTSRIVSRLARAGAAVSCSIVVRMNSEKAHRLVLIGWPGEER